MPDLLNHLKISDYTLDDLRKQRMIDWHEAGPHLLIQIEKYREDYGRKICTRCIGTQQQKDRNCIGENEKDSNGNLKTYCNHMIRAQNSKFKEEFEAHINFHPNL